MDTQTYKYRYTYPNINIICYSSQMVFLTLCLKVFKPFAF